MIGHATFCIVIVYNNVLARLRRTQASLVEASMDLGADGWQTFRYVTLPMIATALVAGGLLAFALSFDEVIVTTFTAGAQNTLPLWIFGNIRLGQQLPQVNVVVLFVIVITIVPVSLAQRLTRDTGVLAVRGGRGGTTDGGGRRAGAVEHADRGCVLSALRGSMPVMEGFGGLFGDPDELQRRMAEFADQHAGRAEARVGRQRDQARRRPDGRGRSTA